ncbi:MAG: site-specific DNA-methyltransferase [Candidatus Peribacteria bacterium]|jgi:DNA modification methylase|nr:site-specific DNA-methyltransferase [Candidatus Peribacteria bacterium]
MTDSEILAEIKKRRQAETEGKTTIRSIGRHNVQQYEHPTQKPVRLVKHAILNSTKTNENVLDMFGGSGTTLIACEDTKRVCYMMELDPAFCEVIIKRYSRYIYATYKKPIKCINRKLELSFI